MILNGSKRVTNLGGIKGLCLLCPRIRRLHSIQQHSRLMDPQLSIKNYFLDMMFHFTLDVLKRWIYLRLKWYFIVLFIPRAKCKYIGSIFIFEHSRFFVDRSIEGKSLRWVLFSKSKISYTFQEFQLEKAT